jgi:hypothetical protein
VPASFGRAGASAGVPTNGISAIDVAQPPSASAESNSTPAATALVFRSTDISPEVSTSLNRTLQPPDAYFISLSRLTTNIVA